MNAAGLGDGGGGCSVVGIVEGLMAEWKIPLVSSVKPARIVNTAAAAARGANDVQWPAFTGSPGQSGVLTPWSTLSVWGATWRRSPSLEGASSSTGGAGRRTASGAFAPVNAGVLRTRPAQSCPANCGGAGRQAEAKPGVFRVGRISRRLSQLLLRRIDWPFLCRDGRHLTGRGWRQRLRHPVRRRMSGFLRRCPR